MDSLLQLFNRYKENNWSTINFQNQLEDISMNYYTILKNGLDLRTGKHEPTLFNTYDSGVQDSYVDFWKGVSFLSIGYFVIFSGYRNSLKSARLRNRLSKAIKLEKPIADPQNNGKIVFIQNVPFQNTHTLKDPLSGYQFPQSIFSFKRIGQMVQWERTYHNKKIKHRLIWSDSQVFSGPIDLMYSNPTFPGEYQTIFDSVPKISVGEFTIEQKNLLECQTLEYKMNQAVKAKIIKGLKPQEKFINRPIQYEDGYFLFSKINKSIGSQAFNFILSSSNVQSNHELGDIRFQYQVAEGQTVTVLGRQVFEAPLYDNTEDKFQNETIDPMFAKTNFASKIAKFQIQKEKEKQAQNSTQNDTQIQQKLIYKIVPIIIDKEKQQNAGGLTQALGLKSSNEYFGIKTGNVELDLFLNDISNQNLGQLGVRVVISAFLMLYGYYCLIEPVNDLFQFNYNVYLKTKQHIISHSTKLALITIGASNAISYLFASRPMFFVGISLSIPFLVGQVIINSHEDIRNIGLDIARLEINQQNKF